MSILKYRPSMTVEEVKLLVQGLESIHKAQTAEYAHSTHSTNLVNLIAKLKIFLVKADIGYTRGIEVRETQSPGNSKTAKDQEAQELLAAYKAVATFGTGDCTQDTLEKSIEYKVLNGIKITEEEETIFNTAMMRKLT